MHKEVFTNMMFDHSGLRNCKRGVRLLTFLAFCIFPFLFFSSLQAQTSTPVIVGYRDFNFGTVVNDELTGEKPESKLWWNDGYWWASMWNNSEGRFKIYRYTPGIAPAWTNSGTSIDNRGESRADVLWDGQKLYVVSHIFSGSNSGVPSPDSLDWAKCYRFSYSGGTYTLDSGFPTYVNNSTSEALVLAKDSMGKLWVTWVENNVVKIANSSDNGLSWGSPFNLPNQGGKVDPDDISAVVAFGGDKIGVMWSNQRDDKMYFIVHNDSDGETIWQAREEALADTSLTESIADDHINLKPATDGSDNLYAAVKTGLTGGGKPLIFLLKRGLSGTWARYQLWGTEDETTRPIIVIDSTHQKLFAFARSLESGIGITYKKEVDLNNISIPSGPGETFIHSDTDLDVNNPTSTKQWVNSESGLLVLCSDKTTNYYMHNFIDLRDITAPVISSFTPAIGPVGTAVTINGSSFTNATEVAFNGVPDTTFSVISDSVIQATVPDSASSGFISVTNTVGTGASLDSFVVAVPPYEITVFTIGAGSITLDPPGGIYDSVVTVTLTALPDSGYVFEGWSGDLSGSANPESVLMNDDKTIMATFVPENGAGGGTITYQETVTGGLSSFTTVATFDTLTAVSGDLYLAAIATRSEHPVSSVTGLGLTWTFVAAQCAARGSGYMEIWKAQGNPTGGDIVTATLSSIPPNAVMAVTRYSGVDPVSPIAGVVSGNTLGLNGPCSGGSDTDTYYFPITTPIDNAVVYGAATMRNKRHYPGSGYKERVEYYEGSLGDVVSIAVQDRTFPSAVTDSLHGRFSNTVDWGVIGLMLKPQGAINAKTLAIRNTGSGSGNVLTSPSGGIYEYLTEVELTAVPDSGSVFSGWSDDLTGTGNPDTLLMDNDKYISATFIRQFTLTVDTVGAGGVVVDPPGGVYDSTTLVNLTAIADSGYVFSGWSGDLTGTANPDSIVMNSNKTVTATFIRQFSLTTLVDGGGSVTLDPPGGIYDSLTVVALTAVPDSGWVFEGWSGDLSGNANPDSIVMDSNKTVTATFIRQFSLTTLVDGGGSITLDPPGGVYDSLTVVTLTAVPDSGWVFSGWSGDLTGIANPDSIVMDSNKTVTATFIRQFSLTTLVDGGGSVTLDPPGGIYDSLTVVALSAVPDSGWVFAGWSGDLTGNANPDSLVMDSNKTVTATFIRQFSLTTLVDGGGSVTLDPPGGIYDSLTVVALTAVPDSGWVFEGWSGDLSGNANPDSIVMDSNKTVTATFIRQFSLTTLVDGGGSITLDPPGGIYDSLTVVTLTAVPDSGWVFAGWSGDLTGSANPDSIVMDSNKTVTATFTRQFSLTTLVDGGGSVTLDPPGGIYDSSTVVTLSAAADSGWVFAGWSGDLTGNANPDSIVMDSNKTVTATFTRQFSLTTLVDGGGSITLDPPGGIYDSSTVVTLSAAADSGWVFAGWSGDLTGNANPDSIVMDSNKTVTATFTRQFSLTTLVDGGGSITLDPPGGIYDSSTVVTLGVVPDSGWVFSGWNGDLSGNANPDSIVMDSNKTVTATFTRQFSLTTLVDGSGSVTLNPPGGVYDSLTVVTLSATADSGWVFAGWSGDLTGSANPDSIVMDSNKTVTATFTRQFSLTTTIDGGGGVTLDPPGGIYDSLTVVTLIAAADSGWLFAGWSGDLTGTANPDSIVMDSNKTVTATFNEFIPVVVNAKIFLEGPYDLDTMKTTLNDSGLLPLSQPFNKAPWNYNGLEAVNNLPSGVVDWVLIGLRNSANATDMFTRAAFVNQDGNVVDTNGTGTVSFDMVNAGNFYLVVYHGNHLPIMSSSALYLDNNSLLYDFTTAQTQSYSIGASPMKELATGVYGLIAGDGNSDGRVDKVDQDSVWRMQNGTAWKYTKLADFNLDGGIDVVDMNVYWRPNFNSFTQVPGVTVTTAKRIIFIPNNVRRSTLSPIRKQSKVLNKVQRDEHQQKSERSSKQNSREQKQEVTSRMRE